MSLKNNPHRGHSSCGCIVKTILIILGVCASMMVLAQLDGQLVIYAILFIVLCCIALPVIMPMIAFIATIALLFNPWKNDSYGDTSDEDEETTRITYNQCVIQQNIYYLQDDQGVPEITDADERTWQ